MGKFVSLYTGGKDSHTATLIAMKDYKLEPGLLLTILTPRDDSYLLHTANIKWAKIHAHIMGIPFEEIEISGSNEDREVEIVIGEIVAKYGVDAIVTGGIASMYQKKRFDAFARNVGVDHIAPLWGLDQEKILRLEVLEYGVGFMIVAAMAMGFTEDWVGRVIDDGKSVEALLKLARKYSFSPVGEGGEYESYVVSSPAFKGKRLIPSGKRMWFQSGWGYYSISEVQILDEGLYPF
jgi:ABC transporter with metal-binding/Fe-S-binding domain ATP-binding protein